MRFLGKLSSAKHLFWVAGIFFSLSAPAQYLDQIGLTTLRAVTTNLNGAGVTVAQAEASAPAFEVNPNAVGQPTNLFTWIAGTNPYVSPPDTSSTFTNSLGVESGHADNVGNDFYGIPNGVATNVAHVNNYDANTFVNYYIANDYAITERIVNQSFTFSERPVPDQQAIDSIYDDYAESYGTLFVSAPNNYGIYNPPASYNTTNVVPPGTAYNCICVGAVDSGGTHNSLGPTIDNGRCKPDLTAPAGATSYSTPQVAGAVAVLMQAALRGDGGDDTNAASDLRTIKVLLLNGAVKSADWTNNAPSPLDYRYGAGVLNLFNSYEQLAGGKQNFCASNSVASGTAHPPVAGTNFVAVTSGWDFESLASDATNDVVKHYFFNVSNGMATVTLVWNRQFGQTNINNLDLFLYDCANSNLVACSTSLVDNVEHIFVPKLAAGRYDLQVWKAGGSFVSASESYALAWAFVSPALGLAPSGTNAVLSWPVYPAGFRAEAATNLAAPVWITNGLSSAVITNSRNSLILNATNVLQFFRLRSPNF